MHTTAPPARPARLCPWDPWPMWRNERRAEVEAERGAAGGDGISLKHLNV